MMALLTRSEKIGNFEIIKFDEAMILDQPVENWPVVHRLLVFASSGFPLEKAIQYQKLRRPLVVNNLEEQKLLTDRVEIYKKLEEGTQKRVDVGRDLRDCMRQGSTPGFLPEALCCDSRKETGVPCPPHVVIDPLQAGGCKAPQLCCKAVRAAPGLCGWTRLCSRGGSQGTCGRWSGAEDCTCHCCSLAYSTCLLLPLPVELSRPSQSRPLSHSILLDTPASMAHVEERRILKLETFAEKRYNVDLTEPGSLLGGG